MNEKIWHGRFRKWISDFKAIRKLSEDGIIRAAERADMLMKLLEIIIASFEFELEGKENEEDES